MALEQGPGAWRSHRIRRDDAVRLLWLRCRQLERALSKRAYERMGRVGPGLCHHHCPAVWAGHHGAGIRNGSLLGRAHQLRRHLCAHHRTAETPEQEWPTLSLIGIPFSFFT